MLHQSTYRQIELGANEAVSLRRTKDCELRCVRGQVWITEENSHQDVVLRAGESYRLTRPGRTVVQSLGQHAGAQCQLVPAPRRLLTLLRRWLPDAAAGKSTSRLVPGA